MEPATQEYKQGSLLRALYDFVYSGNQDRFSSFKAGDTFVYEGSENQDWCWVKTSKGLHILAPTKYLALAPQGAAEASSQHTRQIQTISTPTSVQSRVASTLEPFSWFAGIIERQAAEHRLSKVTRNALHDCLVIFITLHIGALLTYSPRTKMAKPGAFLVRESSAKPDAFSLSVQ
jgi:hypothetical protein